MQALGVWNNTKTASKQSLRDDNISLRVGGVDEVQGQLLPGGLQNPLRPLAPLLLHSLQQSHQHLLQRQLDEGKLGRLRPHAVRLDAGCFHTC